MSLSQLQAPRIENNYGSLASSLLSAGSNSTNVSINAQNQAINNMSNAFKTLSDKLYDYNGSKALATANKIDNINDYNRAMEDGTINLNGLRMEDMAKLDQRKNTLIQRENAMLQLGQQQRAVEDEMNARDFEAKNPDAIAHYNELMAKGDLLGAKNYLKELQASGALTAGGYSWIKNKQNILDGLNDFKTLEDIRQGDERLAEQARANRAREGLEAKNLALKEQQLKAQAKAQAKAQQGNLLNSAALQVIGAVKQNLDPNDKDYYTRVMNYINAISTDYGLETDEIIGLLDTKYKFDVSTLKATNKDEPILGGYELGENLNTAHKQLWEKDNPKSSNIKLGMEATENIFKATTWGEADSAIGDAKAKADAKETRLKDDIAKSIGINSGGNQKVHLMDKSTRDLLQKVDRGDIPSTIEAWKQFTGIELKDGKQAEFIKDLRENLQEFNQDNKTDFSLSDYLLAKVQNEYDGSWKWFGLRSNRNTDDYVGPINLTRMNMNRDYYKYDQITAELESARKEMDSLQEAYSKNNNVTKYGYETFATEYTKAQARYYRALDKLQRFGEALDIRNRNREQ